MTVLISSNTSLFQFSPSREGGQIHRRQRYNFAYFNSRPRVRAVMLDLIAEAKRTISILALA